MGQLRCPFLAVVSHNGGDVQSPRKLCDGYAVRTGAPVAYTRLTGYRSDGLTSTANATRRPTFLGLSK